ncbi:MAG: hypothetical protein E7031_03085 [Akkermansiaceae bacterium]|nr:hypothetical protein [Akkermansiaceae bacterium]
MSNKMPSGTKLSEDDIVELLAGLKMEPHPEANFEDRFVHDFRDRVARYAVTRPARRVLWEHILLRLTNIGKLKWACGATTLGVGVLAVGFLSWPADSPESQSRLAPAIGTAKVVNQTPVLAATQKVGSSNHAASVELEPVVFVLQQMNHFDNSLHAPATLSASQFSSTPHWKQQSNFMMNNDDCGKHSVMPGNNISTPQYITLPAEDSPVFSLPEAM